MQLHHPIATIFLATCLCAEGGLCVGQETGQETDPPGKSEKEPEQRPLVLPPKTRPTTSEQPPEFWVSQLSHPQFLRRELATKKLVAAGPQAIEAVVEGLEQADLEMIERSLRVLSEIALGRHPDEDGGAWDELQKLSARSAGMRAARSEAAVKLVRKHRSRQAKSALSAAGVFVGVDEFIVRASSNPELMVQLDENWRGDIESLRWLRWLDGVEFARVKGKAVRNDVLQALVQSPDLVTVAIVDSQVDQSIIDPLASMERIDALEFRYVKLTPELCDSIAKLPIRVSLNLMGTGVSLDKVEAMRAALPGLTIDHKQGGFLGVTCFDNFEVCQISGIVPDSAAEAAGLAQGDVIVQIGDAEVRRFRDLQNAINQHLPGDEIEVRFMRGAEAKSVQLRLRRLDEK